MKTTTEKKPRYSPFPKVSGRYGAPMGRRGDNDLQNIPKLFAMHQGGTGGYDKGGAYWGYPSDVWAVWGRDGAEVSVTYVRASGRESAINQVRNPE